MAEPFVGESEGVGTADFPTPPPPPPHPGAGLQTLESRPRTLESRPRTLESWPQDPRKSKKTLILAPGIEGGVIARVRIPPDSQPKMEGCFLCYFSFPSRSF